MIARPLAFLPVLLLCVAGRAHGEETVRIAIVERADRIVLSGKGLRVRKLEAGETYSVARDNRSVVALSRSGELLLDGVAVHAPDGVKYRSEGFVHVAGKPVRGQIEVRLDRGKLTAINVIPLEEYLVAVLGSEMPAQFPLEALKAQAVAARTYALQRKLASWGKPYHLGATVLSQVYGGAHAETARTRSAVEATRGEVLVWRMEPIEAYFHSSCGGRTESGADALGRALAYLQPVPCPCPEQAKTDWTARISLSELASLARGARRLSVLDRTATGRVRQVEVTTASGARPLAAVELRRALGYTKVRSLRFTVERRGTDHWLKGKGFGHGAGMCQWGAKVLAERGWDYARILSHYYLGAELRRMY